MITIDISEAMAGLAVIAARAENPQSLMETIGAQQQASVQSRIRRDKMTPWGSVWAPWMPSTQKARERKGNAAQGLLWDKGTLLQSVHFDAASQEVVIGTEVPYAEYLQDGTERMEAREFLGWNEGDFPSIEGLAVLFLETGL
ncbi:MAG: phage virion morphogenesis protein [Xanthobacteraceae bacterium]